jgi:tRNA threonylcarbamoyl adenosine modification protein YjeE
MRTRGAFSFSRGVVAEQRVDISSLDNLRNLAETLAKTLKCGDVVTLSGDLGAGKTTFAQFLIQALSPAPVEVTSPTFTLLQTYPVQLANGVHTELYHFDLYRIEHAMDLEELGLREALDYVTLIEWPERLPAGYLTPSIALQLNMDASGTREARWTTP